MFSPDGKWWWNGTRWVGAEWGPKRPPTKRPPGPTITAVRVVWIVALFAAVGIAFALLVVGLASHQYH